jgi:ABC-type glycerol-3-phosphate transport system substrate-binding protein
MENRKVIYIILASLGILIFILAVIFGLKKPEKPKNTQKQIEIKPITIFGTLEPEKFQLISTDLLKINYFYFSENEIYQKFLESLAKGEEPDALLISDKIFNIFQDKINPILSSNIDIFDFLKNTYNKDGNLLAYPVFVDPIVFVANKKIFLSLGILQTPKTFDELNEFVKNIKLILKERSKDIGIINLGTFSNNEFAIDILTLFALNFGAESKDIFSNYPNEWTKAINYYFSFSDPQDPNYSFNENFPNVIESFAQEKLITALIPLSSLQKIKNLNPSIEFLISSPPTKDILNRKSLFNSYLLILPKVSKNKNDVLKFISIIYNYPQKIINAGYLPPRKGNYDLGEINDLISKEILVARSIIWPKRELIENAIYKAKVELSYNKDVGKTFIENFK